MCTNDKSRPRRKVRLLSCIQDGTNKMILHNRLEHFNGAKHEPRYISDFRELAETKDSRTAQFILNTIARWERREQALGNVHNGCGA